MRDQPQQRQRAVPQHYQKIPFEQNVKLIAKRCRILPVTTPKLRIQHRALSRFRKQDRWRSHRSYPSVLHHSVCEITN